MRICLDTNVLISAFIAHGACHELLEHVARHHEVVLSRYILDEVREKLTEKFGFPRRAVGEVLGLLRSRAEVVKPAVLDAPPAVETDDVPVLGTAIAGRCSCLVTGDKGLLALGRFESVGILSPAAFWRFEASEEASAS